MTTNAGYAYDEVGDRQAAIATFELAFSFDSKFPPAQTKRQTLVC
jgi:hypothetical protein